MSVPGEKRLTGVDLVLAAFAGFLAGAFLGALLGGLAADHYTRAEAAKAGAGRWVTAPETGSARFEWVTPKKEVRP